MQLSAVHGGYIRHCGLLPQRRKLDFPKRSQWSTRYGVVSMGGVGERKEAPLSLGCMDSQRKVREAAQRVVEAPHGFARELDPGRLPGQRL